MPVATANNDVIAKKNINKQNIKRVGQIIQIEEGFIVFSWGVFSIVGNSIISFLFLFNQLSFNSEKIRFEVICHFVARFRFLEDQISKLLYQGGKLLILL